MNKVNIVDIIQDMSLAQLQRIIDSTSYEYNVMSMEARDRIALDVKMNRYIFDCSSDENDYKDTVVILIIDTVGNINLDIV